MEKKMHKVSVRLSEEDYLLIEQYPGKTISQKVRSLLELHQLLMNKAGNGNLAEKYETILKEYLQKYDPEVCLEVDLRRKELRRYTDTLEEVQRLQQLVDELREDIYEFRKKSGEYLEKRVADCVIVHKELTKTK